MPGDERLMNRFSDVHANSRSTYDKNYVNKPQFGFEDYSYNQYIPENGSAPPGYPKSYYQHAKNSTQSNVID
jgi:hypothetical protein